MPVELAMPIYHANDEFQSRKSSKYKRPLRPCLHPNRVPPLGFRSPPQQPERNGVQESSLKDRGRTKKQVSFADHKGLALTMVKIFSKFDDPIDVPLSIQQLFSSALRVSEEENKLVLDFAQPSADYLRFRQRLEEDLVCLENCMLKDRAVAGTVKVKNLSFEKFVKVRITFDTWKSHTDVDCLYIKDTYVGSDRDTFSFEVNLPEQVPPHERIEFAVFYVVNGITYWDSNRGQNYRIIHSSLKRSSIDFMNSSSSAHQRYGGGGDWDIHFDRYGSPRCSHGIFAEWPSYAGYEELGPYY
ncbi:protein phosphatase 1 regulatory subunit 3B [Astyanax mexicanus]|uniref:protein phosphatase 1 regulatory subunit 3B n=1 Tax=Astyanax mexicanus TaxID=7994 RepID=UPI0020CB15EA|nr:protein phosphatase 1 regulatory subunit 3B [Astyanax mexicanus]